MAGAGGRTAGGPERQPRKTDLEELTQFVGGHFNVSGVIDHDVRGGPFAFEGPLAGLAPRQFISRPAATGRDTLETQRPGRIEEDEQIAEVLPAGLQQHSRIEHQQIAIEPGLLEFNLPLQFRTDHRMNDRLQPAASGIMGFRLAENDGGEIGSQDAAGVINDAGAKRLFNLASDFRLLQSGMPGAIGIESHHAATSAERRGQGTLAAADAPRNSDHWNAATSHDMHPRLAPEPGRFTR